MMPKAERKRCGIVNLTLRKQNDNSHRSTSTLCHRFTLRHYLLGCHTPPSIASSQLANLNFLTTRYPLALYKCLPTRKCDEMIPKAERKRCAWPDDLNRLIIRSRNLVG